MINVTITINGSVILSRSAVRVKTGEPNVYHVDDGTVIQHSYEEGAVPLAIQMLQTIRQPGYKNWKERK